MLDDSDNILDDSDYMLDDSDNMLDDSTTMSPPEPASAPPWRPPPVAAVRGLASPGEENMPSQMLVEPTRNIW